VKENCLKGEFLTCTQHFSFCFPRPVVMQPSKCRVAAEHRPERIVRWNDDETPFRGSSILFVSASQCQQLVKSLRQKSDRTWDRRS
jgi:hypothetical protein